MPSKDPYYVSKLSESVCLVHCYLKYTVVHHPVQANHQLGSRCCFLYFTHSSQSHPSNSTHPAPNVACAVPLHPAALPVYQGFFSKVSISCTPPSFCAACVRPSSLVEPVYNKLRASATSLAPRSCREDNQHVRAQFDCQH